MLCPDGDELGDPVLKYLIIWIYMKLLITENNISLVGKNMSTNTHITFIFNIHTFRTIGYWYCASVT